MTAVRITGMSSGLPPNIVEQIMEAERMPIKQMEVRKVQDEEKLKLVSDLDGKIRGITTSIGELTGTRGFNFSKLVSGDPNVISGVVDSQNSVSGTWHVEVEQLAHRPGAISNGFPDKDSTQIGLGYIKFDTPDGQKEVYINQKNSTLQNVAANINAAKLGLRATVINDRADKENPFKLLVTGLNTGDDNQVHFPIVYMLDGDQDFYFDYSKQAQNGKIKVDGFEMEIPDNLVKDVIPGVDLELKQAAPGREIAVTVKDDTEVISGKIKSFVESYNSALGFIQAQHKLQKDKSGRDSLGPLGGDGMIRSIESTLRRIILSPQYIENSNINQLSDIGIEFNRNGTLNFNQERFNKILTSRSNEVGAFLQGDGFNIGFIPLLKREIVNLTNNTFGPLTIRKRAIEDKIKSQNDRIDKKEKQLERKEEQLRKKFADLETTMSKLQAQGASLGGVQVGLKSS